MHDGTDWGTVLIVLALLGVAAYLLPLLIAASRGHENTVAIGALNILLGWTMLGWIAALVWALTSTGKRAGGQSPSTSSPGAATRSCPFCAEPVLIAAIKCKHCGSDLKPSMEQPIEPSSHDVKGSNTPRPVEHKARELAVGVLVGVLVICGGAFGLSQFWGAITGPSGAQASAASAPSVAEPSSASQPDVESSASSSTPSPEPAPPIAVTAFELQRAYGANTVAADDKYKGVRLLVSGTVKDINTDIAGAAYLVLASGDEFSNPKATMASSERTSASKLRQGQAVTLLCVGGGDILKSAMLENCVFSAPGAVASESPPSETATEAVSRQTSGGLPPPQPQAAAPVVQPQSVGFEPAKPGQELTVAERMESDCSTGANALRQAFDRVLAGAQTGVHVARTVNVQNRKAYGCEVIFDMTDGNQIRGQFAADSKTVRWTADEAEPLAYEKLVMSRSLALSQSDEGQ